MTIQTYLQSLRHKQAAVIGIGVSNTPLIRLLRMAGVAVTACDKKNREALGELAQELEALGCTLRLGEDYLEHLQADVIFRTPGLHPRFLEKAMREGAEVTSEMEVFFRTCPCPIIAVTGSDGKTTTTTMIAGLLRAAGFRVHLGGNIGKPLLAEVERIQPEDYAVVELSSFQLMTMQQSPHIAVLTNLSPNHLDVHKDYEEYCRAKSNIFTHQNAGDILVLNADDADSLTLAAHAVGQVRHFSRRHSVERGTCVKNGTLILAAEGTPIVAQQDILLPGLHNVENFLAAFAAVEGLVSCEIMADYARTFGGVPHRIELVRKRNGVRWYNDSIASSPSRTIAGLRAFSEQVVLIAGGKDKGISYEAIGPEINRHVRLLILCGATADVIRRSVLQAENYDGLEILEVDSYPAAVALADSRTGEGDVVLLSPASTSFDRFRNFEERGQVFRQLVMELD